jgi:hypothetical protein
MGNKEKKRHRDRDDEDPDAREKRKAAKKAEKVAQMLGYSNEVNPFGDSNLLQPFVWGKKVTKERSEGKKVSESDAEANRLKLMQDIDRVRKRREEREKELEEMERLRAEEQRLRESAMYGDWQQKEEDFHLEQTAIRSKIRLSENRQQPVDVLAKAILLIESALAAEADGHDLVADSSFFSIDTDVRDPVLMIEGLDVDQLEQLQRDCDNYRQLEAAKGAGSKYLKFWSDLVVVVTAQRRRVAAAKGPVHESVATDVEDLFRGKSEEELDLLQRDVERSIREQRSGGDVSYWEEMAEQLTLQRARAAVQSTHRQLLKKQVEILARIRAAQGHADAAAASSSSSSSADFKFIGPNSGGGGGGDDVDGSDSAVARMAKEKGLENREEQIGARDEVALAGGTYSWQDKYRPRKPRYFNRVRTGWDWNKYNSTHYDFDNPPPRKILGYKFTVFYPDLIDKSQTPKYFVEATDEKDFAVIRFHAGPPYEDVAFKILNKEWDINRKSGFRCVFDRGVLHVHFNFKRSFYRR